MHRPKLRRHSLGATYHPLVPERLEIFELSLGGVVALGVGLVKHFGGANPENIWKMSLTTLIILGY